MKLVYHRQMVRRVLEKLKVGPACIDCAEKANSAQDLHQATTEYHFDGCDFEAALEYVGEQWREIDRLIATDCRTKVCDIFAAWGRITHAIQDFYAHSNWIELGNDDIWDETTIPDGLVSGIFVLSRFRCSTPGKECPTHGALVHGPDDISKDDPSRRNFGKAIRLAFKHTERLARRLRNRLPADCLQACS